MENIAKNKKIMLTGGGTAGSVSPLLALAEDLRSSSTFAKATADKGSFEFVFVGTKNGVEKQMVKETGIPYRTILAGKLRRYFAWQNFLDIFKIKLAFWQALFLILKEKPDLIMSAGSFVSVPVVWAGWVLRIPILIHQQDVRPGLANKFMAPFARVITVTFEKSLADYGSKAIWTGNPVRKQVADKREERTDFNLKNDLQIVFITGGGTGAEGINKLVEQGLDNLLSFCQIIHSTGKGKMTAKRHDNYRPFEFLNAEEMAAAFKIADVVVSRAGLAAMTEISADAKPAIIIPMPNSHQEDNAAIVLEKNAAIVLNQEILNSDSFVAAIKALLDNPAKREELSRNVKLLFKEEANENMINIILKLLVV